MFLPGPLLAFVWIAFIVNELLAAAGIMSVCCVRGKNGFSLSSMQSGREAALVGASVNEMVLGFLLFAVLWRP